MSLSGTAALKTVASGAITRKGVMAGTAAIATKAAGVMTSARGGELFGTASIATSAAGVLSSIRRAPTASSALSANLPLQVGPIVVPETGSPTQFGQHLFQRLIARTGGLPGVDATTTQATAGKAVTAAATAQSAANVAQTTGDTANANAVLAQITANTARTETAAETVRAEAAEALLAPLLNPAFTAGIRIAGAGGTTWTSGAGAPVSTQPVGSLYSNSTGTLGARLYVSAGGGVWNAIPGV